jgi:hypothetical protein
MPDKARTTYPKVLFAARFRFANEQTFLAWSRTALALSLLCLRRRTQLFHCGARLFAGDCARRLPRHRRLSARAGERTGVMRRQTTTACRAARVSALAAAV